MTLYVSAEGRQREILIIHETALEAGLEKTSGLFTEFSHKCW